MLVIELISSSVAEIEMDSALSVCQIFHVMNCIRRPGRRIEAGLISF